jgi:uncharacterized protein YggU (UPF0235/DUF167 family)
VSDARIAVRCTPRASRDELAGVRDGALIARVRAPPREGEANRALCRLIAARAGIPASNVRVVRGLRGRDKLVAVKGLDQDALLRALGADEPS